MPLPKAVDSLHTSTEQMWPVFGPILLQIRPRCGIGFSLGTHDLIPPSLSKAPLFRLGLLVMRELQSEAARRAHREVRRAQV